MRTAGHSFGFCAALSTDSGLSAVVDPREGFHTERYIFPVGYEAIR